MEVITPMLYCSKCHALYENGTTCSNCNEPLTEPKPGNLVLLTAAMYAESNEILDAFRARGIYIDRKPTIEEGVFELFVQYADWEKAIRETVVRIKQNSMEQRRRNLDPTDMNGLKQIIDDKRRLQELEKLHISFN